VALLGVPLRRPPVFFPVAIYFPSTIEQTIAHRERAVFTFGEGGMR
jgi:hypothetical protein